MTASTPNTPASNDFVRDMAGETVCGFRVAAYREKHPEHGSKFGHAYSEHWSTPNSRNPAVKVERLFTEEQLRAALAAAPASPEPASNEAPGRGGEIEALRLHVTHLIYAIDGGYFGDNAGLRESAFVEPLRAFVTPGFEPVAAAPSSGELA